MDGFVCPYPVVLSTGHCCGHYPCDIEGHYECEDSGGCIDRSTCGGCWVPWTKEEAQSDRHDRQDDDGGDA
jgi:hypothetical protein